MRIVGLVSGRLLLGGAFVAILAPLGFHLLTGPDSEAPDVLQDLGSAGPFEVLPDGQAGHPISSVGKGGTFAWSFHFCLRKDLPISELLELQRLADGRVITRVVAAVVAGADNCARGFGSLRIPVDARPGFYELTRRIVVRGSSGPMVSMTLSSIPIEVTP